MLSVVATKIRGGSSSTSAGRTYEGFLIQEPAVGRGMVLFRDPNGKRMVTTTVRRVLSQDEGATLYVETDNSVYRLAVLTLGPAAATG